MADHDIVQPTITLHAQLPQQQQHVLPQEQTDMQQSPGLDAQTSSLPFTIDLSDEDDDDEGDLYTYEQYCMGRRPKYHNYAQHGAYGQPMPVTTPLVQIDRATIGNRVVATIVIYITWVILQVLQQSMDRYLAMEYMQSRR